MKGKSDSIYWFRVVLLSFVVVCCAAVGAWSQVVLRVGPGQQYATIQSAVDAARTGDAILVYPSTYKESVSVNKNGSDPTLHCSTPMVFIYLFGTINVQYD